MTGLREATAEALDQVVVHSALSYSWCGRRQTVLSPRAARHLRPRAARALLLGALSSVLYECFYCTGAPVPLASEARNAHPSDAALVAALSEANEGHGSWEPGWRLKDITDDGLIVSMDGLHAVADASQVRCGREPRAVGAPVALRLPKELLSASAGYYTAVSDAEFTGHEKRPLVRFYFDVVPSGGPLLVYILTRGLNDARAWFRLKLLNAPAAYWRSDAAVLYVRSSDLSRARPILAELVCVLEGHIRAPVPAFTKRLALGVAAAEQPRTNESFGQSRCRILAEGIIDAHTEGRRSAGARLEAVEARFGSAGLDLDVPYLESGSIDRLHL